MLKRQVGFTLIELVVVIIILGILAVTAAPRFLGLTTEANVAALEGLAAAMISSSNLVHAKSLVEGVANIENSNLDIDKDGVDDLAIIYGYPSANRTTGIANILDLGDNWRYGDQFGGGELYITSSSFTDGNSGITNNNIPIRQDQCYLTYIPPSSIDDTITITFTTTGC